jgi:transcriptional regulator with XRE-family HTH domain
MASRAAEPKPPKSGIADVQLLIGERIKRARKRQGLTLQDVARKSGLTPGYISQIENNKALPSVAAIFKIGNVLDCPLTFFFDRDGAPDRYVVRKHERKILPLPGSRITCELLSPDLVGKRLDPNIMRFEKGGTTGRTPYSHKEGEVLILVLRGEFELIVDRERSILREGDSAHFNATTPHTIANRAEGPGEILWVATPPTY